MNSCHFRVFDINGSLTQLCRELRQENIVGLEEVLLEDKAIYMVFEYAEHDFLVYAAVLSYCAKLRTDI